MRIDDIKVNSNLKLISRFYDLRIISIFLFTYLLVYFFPIKAVPDYFHIYEIENFRTFIWSLFSVTLGFSGLILTLLLLSYNFYLKSTKRHTLEFVLENIYLKVVFSSFLAIVVLQLFTFCIVNSGNRSDYIAVMYLLFLLTASYIICQLPLAIIGLKYSTSIEKLNKVAAKIDHNDVAAVLNRSGTNDGVSIESLESNRIIVLKDIGNNAIKDNDWILPKKILAHFFNLVRNSLEKECPVVDIQDSILVKIWICRHFQRTAIKNSDHITINAIMGGILSIYELLITTKIYRRNLFMELDEFLKDLMINVIQSRDFSEIRAYWVKDYTTIIMNSIQSLNFSDEALPTRHYIFANLEIKVNHPSSEAYYEFWHYLLNTQFDTLTEVLEFAIFQKDNRTFSNYHWQIRSLLHTVSSAAGLTQSQKRSYLLELLYKIDKLEITARENKLIDEMQVISHLEISKWATNGWNELFRSGMYTMSSTLRYLINEKLTYNHCLNEFFLLGRSIANESGRIDSFNKSEILSYIIETGLKIYTNSGDSKRLKYDIQYQLNWLFSNFIIEREQYVEIIEKYREKIEEATEGFEYSQIPE